MYSTFCNISYRIYVIFIVTKYALHLDHLFHVAGDSGYALRPWLLTPVINAAQRSPEDRYNVAHRRIRSLIERTNGLLKMRFRCLLKHRILHYKPDVASRIVNACVVLHNMCIEEKVPMPPAEEIDYNIDLEINVNNDINENAQQNRINPDNPALWQEESFRGN